MAMPGKKMRCGAEKNRLRSKPIMEPHSACGCWAPRPRNERAATSRMAPPMPSVPCTMSGVSELGRMRRLRIPRDDSPKARDAVTYSRSRVLITEPRMTRA
jgi:hypothetical protein